MIRIGLAWFAALLVAATGLSAELDVTGAWKGQFQYPARAGRRPVPFTVVLVNDGEEVRGVIVEINTLGQQGAEPWLHAWAQRGRYDAATRQVSFSKRYVGTEDVAHLVQYQGQLSADGATISGSWQIPGNWGATFQLTRMPQTGSGPMAGIWTGVYRYSNETRDSDGRTRPPVVFSLYMVQRGRGWWGYSEEPRTFGDGSAPRLFATVEGRETERPGEYKFTKVYDGTGGVNHAVEYLGRLESATQLQGTWEQAGEEGKGTFAAIRVGGLSDLPELEELPELPALPTLDALSRGPEASRPNGGAPRESAPSAPPAARRRRR